MEKQTFLYRFLTDGRYRPGRHVVLLLGTAAVSLNQNIYTYGASLEPLGDTIYLAALLTLVSYLLVGYLHLYLLFPRLLLKEKYVYYLLCSSFSIGLLMLARVGQEHLLFRLAGAPPARMLYGGGVSWLDSLSDFMLNMLCITGISMTGLLKHWMVERERIDRLERQQMQAEVNGLKEQVNPSLLFHTLRRTAELAPDEPEKAAEMVLRLSRLLRYQLYDGARSKVLLSSEIGFLANYLALVKFDTDTFDYRIEAAPELAGLFIPPLLLVPLLECALGRIGRTGGRPFLLLAAAGEEEGRIRVACRFDDPAAGEGEAKELLKMKERLGLLYPAGYTCRIEPQKEEGRSLIVLKIKAYDS